MTGKKNVGKTYMVLGYVPLFQEQGLIQDITTENVKEQSEIFATAFQKAVDIAPNPEFCLWFIEEGAPLPAFGVTQAQKIVDHIKWYSEEEPEEWFYLAINRTEKHYDIALFPKFEKMKERFTHNALLMAETIVKTTDVFNFMFKPLHFRSKNKGSIEGLEFPKRMKLGLVDSTKVDITKGQQNIDPIIIGEFDVNPPGYENSLGYFESRK